MDKNKLIEEAKNKDVQYWVTYDCYVGVSDNDVEYCDGDGDSIWKQVRKELSDFEGVRFQFPPNTNITDVLRILDKIKDRISIEIDRSYQDNIENLFIRK